MSEASFGMSSHQLEVNGGTTQLTALAKADIMSSELTYVIFKPSGLTMVVGVQ